MEAHLHSNNQAFAEKRSPKEEDSPQLSSPSSPPPPSSASSSPSHEFSFTISLQSLSSSFSSSSSKPNPNVRNSNRTTSSSHQPPFAIDLSPADEIFFHGHLLPLHFLSHLPVSPRTSTNSFDGFTLPVKDLLQEQSSTTTLHASSKSGMSTHSHSSSNSSISSKNKVGVNVESRAKVKPNKTFSLFGLSKWRKGFEQKERTREEEQEEEKEKQKKKLMGLDLSHALKKYIRMLFQRRENDTQLKRRQAYSFSSASIMGSRKNNANNAGYKRDLRGRRGEFSAPASMRTSPTNSGHLLVSTGLSSASSCFASDSTMEELQAAIQAAIAHCKNSSAVDHDKVKNY